MADWTTQELQKKVNGRCGCQVDCRTFELRRESLNKSVGRHLAAAARWEAVRKGGRGSTTAAEMGPRAGPAITRSTCREEGSHTLALPSSDPAASAAPPCNSSRARPPRASALLLLLVSAESLDVLGCHSSVRRLERHSSGQGLERHSSGQGHERQSAGEGGGARGRPIFCTADSRHIQAGLGHCWYRSVMYHRQVQTCAYGVDSWRAGSKEGAPDIRWVPSSVKARQVTGPWCPSNMWWGLVPTPVSRVPPLEPAAPPALPLPPAMPAVSPISDTCGADPASGFCAHAAIIHSTYVSSLNIGLARLDQIVEAGH